MLQLTAVLIVVVPLVLAVLIALLGRFKPVAPVLAAVGPVLTMLVAWQTLQAVAATDALVEPWRSRVAASGSMVWFSVGDAVLDIGWSLDAVTGLMLGVVGVVALCVVVFSAGYMHGDPGWNRYFALLAAFAGSMNLLVIADSFTGLFMGWELVGACSYLLIGFWFTKPSAAAAAMKAFLTTRVGDVGLLVGLAILWWTTGSLDYTSVMEALPRTPEIWVSAAAVCIAIGAMGKSAQFPLHAWLPDAMEGPTPVSALIHAATMVAAGVFLIVRVWPLFDLARDARELILVAGTISALGAALAATFQRDIKKVLAYSTVSQLGFMFAALGVGAWFAAFFHLITHAGFKALLFLGSGSVIHGTGTQDIHEMGGLRRRMPVTFVTWLAGVFALAGVPGLSGFFSKDAVLENVFHHAPVAGALLVFSAMLTAFYVARTTRLVFFGEPAPGLHAHESGLSMLIPLAVLAIPTLALGWGAGTIALGVGVESEGIAVGVALVSTSLAALGAVAGWMVGRSPRTDSAVQARHPRVVQVLRSAFGWDAFVDRWIVRPVITMSRALWAFGDRLLVDGLVEGVGSLSTLGARLVSRMQSGDAQSYALAIVVGLVLMFVATVAMGR